MVKLMGFQAPFISSWACFSSYQLSERVPANPGLDMNQVRRVSLFTLELLSAFKVRSHSIRILAPIPALHDNTLIAMSTSPTSRFLVTSFCLCHNT